MMRKGVTALQNVRLLKWCAETGVEPMWNLLWGFPGEPPDEYDRMASLVPSLVHLPPPEFRVLEIQRFSPYFEQPAAFGLQIVGPRLHYELLYQTSSGAVADLAYTFDHRYLDGRDPTTYVGGLRAAVERWQAVHDVAIGALSYRRGPDFVLVEDRRPGLESADYLFEGLEAQIFLGCGAGTTASELSRLADNREAGADVTEIETFLDDLVGAKLVYREGDRFLHLATAAVS